MGTEWTLKNISEWNWPESLDENWKLILLVSYMGIKGREEAEKL